MATDTGFGMVRFFDDFLGDTLEVGPWTAASTNSATAFAINAQVNGVVRGTVTNNSSNDLSVLYGELNWQADDGGPLIMEARVALITSLSLLVFVGLSDQKASEMPIDNNGDTWTTTATDAAGFVYAGGVSSETWHVGGVKGGADTAVTDAPSRMNPVASTFQTLRVVINADGAASFFLNGEIVKENLANAVTVGTSLLPYFSVADDGAAGSLDVDYCYVSKGRA